jgi:DNA polymerase
MKTHAALKRWKHCRRCPKLAADRRNVVIGRGSIPADLLIIGEAPGKTEDLLGEPFLGESGKILKHAIADAAALVKVSVPTYYISNVVCCIPWAEDEDGERELRNPSPTEIANCRPRLASTVALVNPTKVIFLGDVAQTEAKRLCPDGIKLRHPAYVGRRGGIGSCDYRILVRGFAEVFTTL